MGYVGVLSIGRGRGGETHTHTHTERERKSRTFVWCVCGGTFVLQQKKDQYPGKKVKGE